MTPARLLVALVAGAALLAPMLACLQAGLSGGALRAIIGLPFGWIAAIDTLLVSLVAAAAASIVGEVALNFVTATWLRVVLLAGLLIPAPVLAAALPPWLSLLGLHRGHAGWMLAALPLALAMVVLTGFACRHLQVSAAIRPPLGALVAAVAVWDAALTTRAGAGSSADPVAALVLDAVRGGTLPVETMGALTLLVAGPTVLAAIVIAVVISRAAAPPER